MRRASLAGLVATGMLSALTAAHGQNTRPILIRVYVLDSAARVVPDADVQILEGLQSVLAQGTTDERGVRQLSVPRTGGDYQITVRKIGYRRADRFVTNPADSASLTVVLHPSATLLAGVTITAQQDLDRKSYHVDADEILHSPRTLVDGMDVLTNLKPDMLKGRSGDCPVTEVWINGKRQIFAPTNDLAQARRPSTQLPTIPIAQGGSGRRPPQPILATVEDVVLDVMSRIKPEHIDEMTYEDCISTAVPLAHARHALFVVLKPGVGYDELAGSYVIDSLRPRRARAVSASRSIILLPKLMAASSPNRLLGVYDDAGPLEGVVVTDSASGSSETTTTTGTVSLAFIPVGDATLFLTKPGYTPRRVAVRIAATDTTPITAMLTRR